MQSRSNTWISITAGGSYTTEVKAVIGSTEYAPRAAVVISRGLYQSSPSVGGCTAASMELVLSTEDTIPRSAAVEIKVRVSNSSATSEWLSLGVFYVTRRSRDYASGLLTLECYDAMLMTQQEYVPTITSWPATMSAVVTDIAAQLSLSVDSRSEVASYTIPLPSDITMMDVLSGIAAASGGNWIITPGGKLRLVPLVDAPASTDTTDAEIVAVLGSLTQGRTLTVSGVTLTDGTDTYEAGDSTGYVLNVRCPWASQTMCTALYTAFNGLVYHPYTATQAICDPAAELGDTVKYADLVYSVISSSDLVLGPAARATLSASTSDELEDEYPYQSQQTKEIKTIRAEVADKVGYDEIISSINMSPETITIQASKINLTGYITASDLSGSGTTTINGANITTGTISDQAGKFSLNMTTGALTMSDGTFTGTVNTTGGTIGGFTVDAEKLVYGTFGQAESFRIKPTADSSDSIQVSNIGTVSAPVLTVSNKFAVDKSGNAYMTSGTAYGLTALNEFRLGANDEIYMMPGTIMFDGLHGWVATLMIQDTDQGLDLVNIETFRILTNSGSKKFIFAKNGDLTVPGTLNGTINGHSVACDVPANAVFTDTTYSVATTSADGLMSSSDKTKLNGIATGAEVNVQSDWSVTSSSSDAYIKNKPSIPSKTSDLTNDSNFVSDSSYVHTDNNFTGTLKTKLNGIEAGAEVNQNAFSNVKVGSTTIAADGKTDTLTLVAGDNITLTPDATNDKVTIAATDTTYTPASATPQMDGTGAVGSSAKYAREDHVHPTDTSRLAANGGRVTNGTFAVGLAANTDASTSGAPRAEIRRLNSSGDYALGIAVYGLSASSASSTFRLVDKDGNVHIINRYKPSMFFPIGSNDDGATYPRVSIASSGTASGGTNNVYLAYKASENDSAVGMSLVNSSGEINIPPKSHASSTTDYGVGTTANYGHVKLVNNLNASDYAAGEALSAKQGKVLKDEVDGKAPTSHASSATTYGIGTESNYGHVKIVDNLDATAYANGNVLSAYQGKVLQGNINKANYFQAGDTFDVLTKQASLPAMIYNSSKIIVVTVMLPKMISGLDVSIDSYSGLYLRRSAGTAIYYGSTSFANVSSMPSGVTMKAEIAGNNIVRITFTGTNEFVTSSGGSTAVTNLMSIACMFTTLKLSFSAAT